MQGVVFTPENPQQGSPPPNNVMATKMEESLDTNHIKDQNQTDSGIFSTPSMDQTGDSDNRSDCSSPERKYVCPICDIMLTSQHNFTLHIRSHNNEGEVQESDKGFTCRICQKVLSSSSSLDRHVLVHSGERPFVCKYCGDTFTTNGNMHRHMRTHSGNYESDGSSDSGRSVEYNNNNNNNKRKLDIEEVTNAKKHELMYSCPLCQRSDFTSKDNLDAHVADNHPEYPSKCPECLQVFSNNKLLSLHKQEKHSSKKQVVGFSDLTFLDFSSEKFPHIARRECELNMHKPLAGLLFQCPKCTKAFPSSSSLEMHLSGCQVVNLVKNMSEDEIRRAEFFARLNLKDSAPGNKLKEHLGKDSGKDLADIQSILSNINMPKPPTIETSNDSSKDQEEDQESYFKFAQEFRKMKMRGEFPCRLCTAVFPNLRALKGHNRAHLSGNNNGTYYCNMCPHSSMDKGALIRHMRSHNGDRPYECSLCNYAFTTKANCERHLRNRHAKTTREEVKKNIIYHPSEDPTNDELNKLTIEEKKIDIDKCSTPKKNEVTFPTPMLVPDLQPLKPTKPFSNLEFIRGDSERFPPFLPQPYNLSCKPPVKIQVKPFEALRQPHYESEDDYYEEEEEDVEEPPMEEALDLSKKKVEEPEPQDLTKKLVEVETPVPPRIVPNVNEIFAQQLLKGPTALYASQLASLYRNGFPNWGFGVNPLLFQALPQLPPQDIKQRIQLCGGSLIPPMPQPLKIPEPTPPAPKEVSFIPPIDDDADKMDHQQPNSVKMVIKNGVLMPKQKQRRYRTERPFTCEHCSARFTLRSNMERHIKQQHPQFWSQRQRGGLLSQPGRKPSYELHEDTNEKLRYALLAQQLRAFTPHQEKKEDDEDDCALVIDENDNKTEEVERGNLLQQRLEAKHDGRNEEDLVPVSRLLDNASQQQFKEYFKRDEDHDVDVVSDEEDEGVIASGSTSEGNVSGTDDNRSESEHHNSCSPPKKKSAYSLAPNRVSCPYCSRKFPWSSSLRRHILTHTGQKPFKCSHCPLLFTTKSNCDRHLLRKHGNTATTIVTSEANNVNFLMRNVPERPFKCSNCPSSTFSTYSNLKKHISCKHNANCQDDIKAQGYEAGSSEDEKINQDWESQINYTKVVVNEPVHSDLPFKCHLCESSFSERHQALDHIRDKHASEYDLLMSKNALDVNATTPDEHHEEEDSEIRGKFPDYSNRKVICAWCMRRFWSAEDLRRHMRTHTGERPFSCDICRRRFTLKHSMLRHRKKHNGNCHSDEDQKKSDESDAPEGGDLISNLLGLRDRSLIDKVLDATSADDAAKLLGVKNGIKE